MTRDGQVRELFSLLSSGVSLSLASLKTGMDEKTARRYELQRLLNDQSSDAIESARTLADHYLIFGEYGRAVQLCDDVLTTSPRLEWIALHCEILREMGKASESLAIVERELSTPAPYKYSGTA